MQQIQACHQAFAAILADGSVVTWGDASFGGDSSVVQDQLRDVQQIQASGHAFAAILGDGSVVTWGSARHGGDSSAVQDQLRDVQQIQASFGAFAAILGGGSVVTWVMPTLVATAVRCRISCEMRSRSKLLLAHLLQSWVMDLSSLGGMPISAATAVLFRISCYV